MGPKLFQLVMNHLSEIRQEEKEAAEFRTFLELELLLSWRPYGPARPIDACGWPYSHTARAPVSSWHSNGVIWSLYEVMRSRIQGQTEDGGIWNCHNMD